MKAKMLLKVLILVCATIAGDPAGATATSSFGNPQTQTHPLDSSFHHAGHAPSNANRTNDVPTLVKPRMKKNQMQPGEFCPAGHFGCITNPSHCIPQSSICNNKVDCPEDGSDEFHCDNIHEKDFWDLYFQKRPDADFDKNMSCNYDFHMTLKRPSTSSGDVQLHPDEHGASNKSRLFGCRCVSEKIFCPNLPSATSSQILEQIPKNVEFLDLTGSTIKIQEFTRMGFSRLHTLILSICSIEELPLGVFASLPSLETLHLTNNRLKTILNGAFKNNHKLVKLFLGYNELGSLSQFAFQGLDQLQQLDLRHNKLTGIEPDVYRNLKALRILQLSENRIKSLEEPHYNGMDSLEILNLGSNSIEAVYSWSLQNLPNLKQLHLPSNKIRELNNNTFCNLASLLNLNLKGNEIARIHSGAFSCLENLESLNLERNRFGELDLPKLIFENLTKLQHIYFPEFWQCWWASQVRHCEPKGDGISSVENLLDNILLRTCVWIMGLLSVVGNAFVITSRFLFREKNRAHSFYIKNLALADFMMGVFLLSIAVHDVKFRGQFLDHQHSWRHSMTCKLSGMLSTLSSEGSVLILTLITLDRYLSIVKPFAERTSSLRPAIAITTVLWIISFGLSYLPLAGLLDHYFGKEFYTSNGLCLPLQIHNPFDPGWEYSFVLFVVLNSIAFSFICYAYWTMLRIIQASSTTLRTNQQNQDGILAMRFGLVVVTDFICWAPVIIGRILAMSGVEIPSTFYAWLAVFVLPVNSSLNPILYTLTTKLFKQQMSKLTLGVRKRLRRGLADDSSASLSFFYRATHRTTTTSMGNSMSVTNSTKRGRSLAKGLSESENQSQRRRGHNATSSIKNGREQVIIESNGGNSFVSEAIIPSAIAAANETALTTISSNVPETRPTDSTNSQIFESESL